MQVDKKSLLVIDPSPELYKKERKIESIVFAKSGKEAQEYIVDSAHFFRALFINANIASPWGLPLLRFSHKFRPQVPIFFMIEEIDNFPFLDKSKELGIQKIIKRPISTKIFFDLLGKELNLTIKSNCNFNNIVDPSIVEDSATIFDDNFIPIAINLFSSEVNSCFNIYIRLGQNHYVKILKSNENFNQNNLISYLNKGIKYFYILRNEQEKYLNYCEQLILSLLNDSKSSITLAATHIINHGEQTLQMLKDNGLKKENLYYAEQFTKNVYLLSQKITSLTSHHLFKQFMMDLIGVEHSIAVTMMASLVSKELGIDNFKSVDLVGLSAFLHDIGKYQMCPDIFHECEYKMTPAELARYRYHPEEGARILRQFNKIISPVVIQAVEQHHERRDKSGFPNQIGGARIHLAAEIVGICDEFNNLLNQAEHSPRMNPLEEFEAKILHKFQPTVGKAFNRAILNKMSQ